MRYDLYRSLGVKGLKKMLLITFGMTYVPCYTSDTHGLMMSTLRSRNKQLLSQPLQQKLTNDGSCFLHYVFTSTTQMPHLKKSFSEQLPTYAA